MRDRAPLIRGAFVLLPLLAVCVIPFALAHRQPDVGSESNDPARCRKYHHFDADFHTKNYANPENYTDSSNPP